jgi:hypothetical protein
VRQSATARANPQPWSVDVTYRGTASIATAGDKAPSAYVSSLVTRIEHTTGRWFVGAILGMGIPPTRGQGECSIGGGIRHVLRDGACIRGPTTQLHWTGHDDPEVVIVGDRTGALKAWFDGHAESILFLRPDRCIAGASIAQLAPELSEALFEVLCITKGGKDSHERHNGVNGVNGTVLHVPQPAAESAGTIT